MRMELTKHQVFYEVQGSPAIPTLPIPMVVMKKPEKPVTVKRGDPSQGRSPAGQARWDAGGVLGMGDSWRVTRACGCGLAQGKAEADRSPASGNSVRSANGISSTKA